MRKHRVKDFSCSEASKVRKVPSEALSAHSKHKLNKQSFGSVARTKLGRSLRNITFEVLFDNTV
jgi:hypothetical protein